MKILGTILISAFLFGCGSQEENSGADVAIDTTVVTTTEVEPNPHDLIMIDGQKWVIDEGMRVSIDSIELRMQAFSGTTLADYEALSGDLKHHTKTVISSCTMKGQAHDELHKWLLPFIDLRKELIGITAVEDGEEIATELNNELTIFNTYFK
ncbi:MAG: hypothetical protein GQ574_15415 [Crocinitomix sp.]|nr:hypothetical protein [Crocinitomix sp.]